MLGDLLAVVLHLALAVGDGDDVRLGLHHDLEGELAARLHVASLRRLLARLRGGRPAALLAVALRAPPRSARRGVPVVVVVAVGSAHGVVGVGAQAERHLQPSLVEREALAGVERHPLLEERRLRVLPFEHGVPVRADARKARQHERPPFTGQLLERARLLSAAAVYAPRL